MAASDQCALHPETPVTIASEQSSARVPCRALRAPWRLPGRHRAVGLLHRAQQKFNSCYGRRSAQELATKNGSLGRSGLQASRERRIRDRSPNPGLLRAGRPCRALLLDRLLSCRRFRRPGRTR